MTTLRTPKGVSEVVAIILLVAITVVLTTVLWIFVANISNGVDEVPPRVLLTNTGNPAGQAEFVVSSVDARPLGDFRVRLWVNGFVDNASAMTPVAAGTVGRITFVDLEAGGTLTQGDMFVVQTSPSTAYAIFLLWKGDVVDQKEWST